MNALDLKQQQFRKEVNWCIEQLRMGIYNKNPTQKQVKECDRVIKILVSTTAPLVKKRQAMHQMFGDYRKKIDLEEKAWIKETIKELEKMSISSVNTKDNLHSRKSEFYRTATNSVCKNTKNNIKTIEKSSECDTKKSSSFKFCFSIS